MLLWRSPFYSNLLYPISYSAISRRLFVKNNSASWFWLRTQVGYFAITKTGGVRKTNFSGGTERAKFSSVDNNDGTVSYKVIRGQYKDYFISLDGDRVHLHKTNKAHLIYDAESLILTYKSGCELNNSELYVNTITGYFHFGFDELNKYKMEQERWANPKGIEKLALTPDGWQLKERDGYERCALRYETEITEHSSGLI
eukprot:38500_1